MRGLIADNSDLIRERLQQKLRQFGQVEVVGSYNNGTKTIEALFRLKPDMA